MFGHLTLGLPLSNLVFLNLIFLPKIDAVKFASLAIVIFSVVPIL